MGHFKSVSVIQDVQSVVIFVTCFFSFYKIQKLQLGKRLTIQIWQMKVLQINMYHVLLVVNVVDMKCLPTYMEFIFGGGAPTRIFFLTTILLLKVAKRLWNSGCYNFRHARTFKDLHDLENPHIGLQDLKFE